MNKTKRRIYKLQNLQVASFTKGNTFKASLIYVLGWVGGGRVPLVYDVTNEKINCNRK